ncbi:MAG: LysR family transcriptional regulator [Casimicrobiaceae bacterium]
MPTWRPDLQSLRLFVAVCEEASISRAAEREAIAASAISKRIAEIEDLTGVSLLVRGARGVRPTAAGTSFLHHAREILRSTEKLQSELAEYAKGVRGHARVFANISSLIEFLPRDISSFLASNDQVRVDLHERSSPHVLEAVRDGSAELGICIPSGDVSDLDVLPYATDRLAVLAHTSHPLAGREAVTFDEALDYDFVALSPGSGTTMQLSMLAARRGRSINYRVYVRTFEAAAHLIAENLAIGILAVDALKSQLATLPVCAIPLAESWAQRQIILCVRSRVALAPPARALLEHFIERAAGRQVSA